MPGPVQRDNNNWAPRVGFAWTPTPEGGLFKSLFGSEGQSVIRGGYGVGYDVLFYNILTVNGSNYPRVVVGRASTRCSTCSRASPRWAAAPCSTRSPPTSTRRWTRSIRAPITGRSSAPGSLARRMSVEFGYNGSISRNGVNQLQANPAVLTEAQAATVRQTLNGDVHPDDAGPPRLPAVRPARADRHHRRRRATTRCYAQFTRRLAKGLQFRASYTFGRNFSNNDESLGVAAITGGLAADPAGLQRHRCGVEPVGVRPHAPRRGDLAVRDARPWATPSSGS